MSEKMKEFLECAVLVVIGVAVVIALMFRSDQIDRQMEKQKELPAATQSNSVNLF